jgi:hypothetical protein
VAEAPAIVNRYSILATTDLDADGNPEAIVYEQWANDYGVDVLGNTWDRLLHSFSCGNV